MSLHTIIPSARFAAFCILVLAIPLEGCNSIIFSNVPHSPPPNNADPDRRADLLIAQMTQDEKLQLVHGNISLTSGAGPRNAAGWVPGIPSLGIPDLLYADGPAGVGEGPESPG